MKNIVILLLALSVSFSNVLFAHKIDVMVNNKKYVGFSITAGHPSRVKEFEIKEN